MEQLLSLLEKFFAENSPAIIKNASTDQVLLCLNPKMEIQGDMIFMQFESLNERGGNSVQFKGLQAQTENTLFLENEDQNILKLQPLSLATYKEYVQPHYSDTPDFDSLEELVKYINLQSE